MRRAGFQRSARRVVSILSSGVLSTGAVLAGGGCSASTPPTLTVQFTSDPPLSGLRSAACPKSATDFAVYFNPVYGEGVVEPVLSALEANPAIGLVGYVDQAAGYQEFLSIFADQPDISSALTPDQIPPSLRAFVATKDLDQAKASVAGMTGIARVSSPPAPPRSPVAIGVLQFERGQWRDACRIGPWKKGTPPIPPTTSTTFGAPATCWRFWSTNC